MGSNFEVTLDPEFAKNQKMVLTNVVPDAILYLDMKNQPMLQKFPYPNIHTVLMSDFSMVITSIN